MANEGKRWRASVEDRIATDVRVSVDGFDHLKGSMVGPSPVESGIILHSSAPAEIQKGLKESPLLFSSFHIIEAAQTPQRAEGFQDAANTPSLILAEQNLAQSLEPYSGRQ
jgi:hypothetical protein